MGYQFLVNVLRALFSAKLDVLMECVSKSKPHYGTLLTQWDDLKK